MTKFFSLICTLTVLCFFGCSQEKQDGSTLKFGVAAEYPPFEFYQNGEIVGFDIDLARLIGQELNKEIIFQEMQFSTILAALGSGQIDAAISTFTITEERKKNFDFSEPYYFEGLAAVFPQGKPISRPEDLNHKKIAVQMGTTMEIWLRKNVPTAEITTVDSNNQAIESLKAGHVDLVFADGAQAKMFAQKNAGLSYAMIADADEGYGIVLPKNSPLKKEIDQALKNLQERGEIQKLKEKWLGEHGSPH